MIKIAGFPSRRDETEDRDQAKKGEKDRRCGPIEMLDHRRSLKYAARMQRAETGMSASWAQKKNGKAKSVGSMELYRGTARARAQGRPSSASFIHALLMKVTPFICLCRAFASDLWSSTHGFVQTYVNLTR
jgi:hypothetical protein